MNSQTYPLREGLPPLPPRVAALPVDERGYPTPWFVCWIDGKPDFRIVDEARFREAVRFDYCLICGQPLGVWRSFVAGSMCIVNRISAEPPSHRDCAVFAAQACPFLVLPKAVRRDAKMPEDFRDPPRVMLTRNPGVAVIWTTKSYRPIRVSDGILFEMGEPKSVEWYAQGRAAMRDEVLESLRSGLPALRVAAQDQNSLASLARAFDAALQYVPE
jgi:hypothetical protein